MPREGPDAYAGLTEREVTNAKKALVFASHGRGYASMHGTRPGTIGIVVQSSPVALLAWRASFEAFLEVSHGADHLIQYLVGEKLRDWVDEPLDLDVVLELVTMWWIQETFPTSIYAYSEVSI